MQKNSGLVGRVAKLLEEAVKKNYVLKDKGVHFENLVGEPLSIESGLYSLSCALFINPEIVIWENDGFLIFALDLRNIKTDIYPNGAASASFLEDLQDGTPYTHKEELLRELGSDFLDTAITNETVARFETSDFYKTYIEDKIKEFSRSAQIEATLDVTKFPIDIDKNLLPISIFEKNQEPVSGCGFFYKSEFPKTFTDERQKIQLDPNEISTQSGKLKLPIGFVTPRVNGHAW